MLNFLPIPQLIRTESQKKMTQSQSSKENEDKSGYVPNEATASTFTKPFQNLISRSSTSSPMFNIACSKDGSYDEDTNDQPVDYSKKYTERNSLRQNICFHSVEVDQSSKKEFCNRDTKVDMFGDYAETDLDQPTDYSLRYAEDDTDEDEKENSRYFPGSEQEDTIKTYCTEGTPYETPFNFSTATSMSDLRVDDSKEGDVLRKVSEKTIDVKVKEEDQFKSEVEQTVANKDLKDQKSVLVLNSGLMSPEKSINYCEEGAPDCFSCINSLSSLGGVVATQNIVDTSIILEASSVDNNDVIKVENSSQDVRTFENNKSIAEETEALLEAKNDARVIDKEGKMVTFGGEDHYAEETPLMFSRCSSLGSLSGFEQHSIHDDRSSVVSDFSRRTSGVVSPSELPDSPTQTVPPSPRHHKIPPIDFTSTPQEETARPPTRHLSHDKFHLLKCSVFEDDIAAFKEESTPIQFSAATSLSSLTIDDEPKIIIDSKLDDTTEKPTVSILAETERESSTIVDVTNVVETEADHDQVSDGDEDDEDILAACINMGMQNNRYRQSFKRNNFQKISHPQSTTNLARYQTSSALNHLGANISTVSEKPASPLRKSKTNVEVVVTPDTVHIYCTENTPADISPAGSQSNLSVLSMLSVPEDFGKIEQRRSLEIDDQRNELSDDSSNLSGDDEKILNECIQSGIPKVQQATPPSITSIPVANKSEVLSQIINPCITPSSSLVQSAHSDKNVFCELQPCTSVEDRNDISDNSSISDDEAILTECIQSAMPKVRTNTPPFPRPSSASKKVDIQYDKSNLRAGSSSPGPLQQVSHEQVSMLATVKSELSSENNSSLSEEEEDIMLAQCILSGIPRALNVSPPIFSLSVTTKPELHLQRMNYHGTLSSSLVDPVEKAILQKQLLTASDEAEDFATEDDAPYNFSIVSGINNLSIGPRKNCTKPDVLSTNTSKRVVGASVSDDEKTLHSKVQNVLVRHVSGASSPKSSNDNLIATEVKDDQSDQFFASPNNLATGLSRRGSTNSLSGEELLDSVEDWALLESCINSGMPRSKNNVAGTKSDNQEDAEGLVEENCSVCSYNSYVFKT